MVRRQTTVRRGCTARKGWGPCGSRRITPGAEPREAPPPPRKGLPVNSQSTQTGRRAKGKYLTATVTTPASSSWARDKPPSSASRSRSASAFRPRRHSRPAPASTSGVNPGTRREGKEKRRLGEAQAEAVRVDLRQRKAVQRTALTPPLKGPCAAALRVLELGVRE